MTRFANRLSRFLRQEDGVASIEFVMAVPLLLAVFSASFESGLFMTREIMLEQSLDMVMRELRLGHYPGTITTAKIKEEICDRTIVFTDCEAKLMIELQRVDMSTFAMPTQATECRDLSTAIKPSTTLQIGEENDLMLVRACIVVDALFPTTGIGLSLTRTTNGGGVEIVAVSAFSNEPTT